MAEEKMTIDKLARLTQQEFLEVGKRFDRVDEDIAGLKTDVADIRETMATKQELAAVRSDLKSTIDSSAERVVGEIKEFMQPHIKSLDAVLVDVEKIKEKIKT